MQKFCKDNDLQHLFTPNPPIVKYIPGKSVHDKRHYKDRLRAACHVKLMLRHLHISLKYLNEYLFPWSAEEPERQAVLPMQLRVGPQQGNVLFSPLGEAFLFCQYRHL